MHKHRTKRKGGRRNLANANIRLDPACQDLVKSLLGGLTEGSFASEYLRSEYLSKFCGSGTATPAERRSAAIRKWKDSERINALTNARLRGMDRGYNILPRISFYRFLRTAQHFIGLVLGELSDELVLGSFSGGASTGRRRTESLPAHKFCGLADVTKDAVQYVGLIHQQSELYRQYGTFYSLREVDGAVLFTVPKKSDIDRCACKEPEINMFLQKGVGSHIRRRLRTFGINLNDQSINRRLAEQGSIDNSLSTLDLSAASDSVTIQCVRALLPQDWFLYLNDIRSQSVVVDGVITETEMFSSMGNGFTFELESLIFWALMKSTAYLRNHPGIISVYGDDLIIPSGMYDDATWILGEFGFSVNLSKSFAEGPFRESCGGHYHLGTDVTPFYLRREPTHLTDLIRVANQLRRWALADDYRQYEHPELFYLWNSLKALVPTRFWGGSDVTLDTSLVTTDAPRMRLARITGKQAVTDKGLYMQWHTTNRDRVREPESSFPPHRTDNLCRMRNATLGAVAIDRWFRQELSVPAIPG